MNPEDVPQEGDLLLYFELGDRAKKYWTKQADGEMYDLPGNLGKVPTFGNAFGQAKTFGQNRIINPIVDAATERAQGNFGLKGVGEFFDRNPGAYAPVIGGGLGLGIGALSSLGSKNKRKNLLGNALTGGLLGAGAGGLAWGAHELWGGGAKPPEGTGGQSSGEDSRSVPAGVSGGQNLISPPGSQPGPVDFGATLPDIRSMKGHAPVVVDSATLTPQTNAALNGPFQAAKDQYQTFRPNIRDQGERSQYDKAFNQMVNAEGADNYQEALGAAKNLQGLNQAYGRTISNNLKAPNSPQLAGIGGLASAGVPAGKPVDARLFGIPLSKGPAGFEPSDPQSQNAWVMDAVNRLRPQVAATTDELADIDQSSLGRVDPARSPLGRSTLEYGLGGGAAGLGIQKTLNQFGLRSGPDARYWNQLERGMTGEGAVPGRSLLNPRKPIADTLFGTQLDPKTVNDRGINQIAGVMNQNRTGSWMTPDVIRKALADPTDPNHGAVLQVVKGLGGRVGGGVQTVTDPTSFPLSTMGDNPAVVKDILRRLPKGTTAEDLAEQLRAGGSKAMSPEVEKVLLGSDSPLGNMPKGTAITGGPRGYTVDLQQPTRADTMLGAAKKTVGRTLRSAPVMGGLLGATIPAARALSTGQRVTNTPLESMTGVGAGGLDLGDPKVLEARKQDLLRRLTQMAQPNNELSEPSHR